MRRLRFSTKNGLPSCTCLHNCRFNNAVPPRRSWTGILGGWDTTDAAVVDVGACDGSTGRAEASQDEALEDEASEDEALWVVLVCSSRNSLIALTSRSYASRLLADTYFLALSNASIFAWNCFLLTLSKCFFSGEPIICVEVVPDRGKICTCPSQSSSQFCFLVIWIDFNVPSRFSCRDTRKWWRVEIPSTLLSYF